MLDDPTAAGRTLYTARLLAAARVEDRGIAYLDGGSPALLEWKVVEKAVAAEVGEPEGVRTIVFDFVVELGRGRALVHRMDAEPGEEARDVARAIELALGTERSTASIKSVATDGIPSRWYPDLGSFEEAVLEELTS